MQHFYEDSSGEEESYSEKEYESNEQRENIDLTQQSDNNAECNRNSDSPVSEKGKSHSGADFNHKDEIVTAATCRILTEKHIKLHTEGAVSTFKKKTSDRLSPTQINNILPEPYDVLVENSTQTDFTESVDQNIHQQAVNNEITSGSVTNYKIVVKTGNKLGASTRAQVKIVLYGDRGRTKPIDLLESKTNKIKFQKGKEDHFFVESFSVGHLEKIRIGHDRPELPYAWFLDQITIYDLQQKWTYEFPCAQWLSGQGGDRKTCRDLVLGPYCATSEDINNVPVDPLIQLLSETEKIAEKNLDTNNTSDSNHITLYDRLYIRESTDEESTEESSESNESCTSEEYESEKKVISVQNYVTVETQTVNVNNKPHMTTNIPQTTSYVSKTSKSKSKHKTTKSSSSRQSSLDTSTEDSSSTSAD
uniref:PLAT domain-containing protein n=2 Tax=Octopus bimaculoides TaxID=37653 RepID=A0A0L8FIT1_OCTBM|eukprot:XP_014789461.1 PREDICTED: lipoxygenase homology domain-containing protein 1-like [Octopus bimaculoides]